MKKKKKDKIVMVDQFQKYAEIDEMYSSKWRKTDLLVPNNLRMICAILGVKLEELLSKFMWMVSYSAVKDATDKQWDTARKFFLSCKFGRSQYSKKQIIQMFDELGADRKIYETIDNMEREDMELFWRNNLMYKQHWFKRWFEKNRRKEDISILKEY